MRSIGYWISVVCSFELGGLFTVFSAAVILQLIAYYTSDAKGLDVDKPRNLAKSVTVE